MIEYISNLVFNDIRVIAILLAPFFGIAWLLKKKFTKAPDPFATTFVIGLIGILTVPSIPIYSFEKETIAHLEKSKDFMKAVRTNSTGSLTQPLTLLNPPISYFYIVAPSDIYQHILSNKNKDNSIYLRAFTIQYGKDPHLEYVDVNCKEQIIHNLCITGDGCSKSLIPELDAITGEEITLNNHVLRYRHFNKDMTEQEYADFCQIDYSEAISYVDNAFMKYHSE